MFATDSPSTRNCHFVKEVMSCRVNLSKIFLWLVVESDVRRESDLRRLEKNPKKAHTKKETNRQAVGKHYPALRSHLKLLHVGGIHI